MGAIRTFLIVETCFYRDGLAAALARTETVEVAGRARDLRTGVPLARLAQPDVILLDVTAPSRLDAVYALRSAVPQSQLIALSVDDAADEVVPLAEAGIAGYVTRDKSVDELVAVVRAVMHGEMPCSPRVAAGLLGRVTALAAVYRPRDEEVGLTPRELEIVELIGCGLSNRQIGQQLFIELSTVKNHVHSILDKLQVNGRAEAVALVQRRLRADPSGSRGGLDRA